MIWKQSVQLIRWTLPMFTGTLHRRPSITAPLASIDFPSVSASRFNSFQHIFESVLLFASKNADTTFWPDIPRSKIIKKKNMADLWWKRNVSKINELWCENGSRHWMETDVIRSHRQTLTSASITTVQKWDTFDYYFMIQSPSLIWKNWRSNTQWGLKVNVWRLSSTKRNAKKKKKRKKCFLCPFNSLKPTKLSIYTK